MEEKRSTNPHENHRQRMFDRALKNGFEGFADHELLEMLLFYSIPRVNTNPTAHELLNRFSTVKDVMCASVHELCSVDGVGERSAVMLKLITEMMKRYERAAFIKPAAYRTIGQIARYLHPYFVGVNVEKLYLMLFNNRLNLIDCVPISEGVVNATDVPIAKISREIFQRNAAAVLIAHNHPNGIPTPSEEDIALTEELQRYLSTSSVVLLEHLVFVDYTYQPILQGIHRYVRVSPISQKIDPAFYQNFYEDLEGERELPRIYADA